MSGAGALGVIALLASESAGLLARRFSGFAGGLAAFLAAFVVYESLALSSPPRPARRRAFHRASRDTDLSHQSLRFVALLMLNAAGATAINRDVTKAFASRRSRREAPPTKGRPRPDADLRRAVFLQRVKFSAF
ncbi:hypothetical protein [Methylocystis silviterrae]|uniref:hypothetical protein n=1 Tax=Methylocystis silviterrae TaxID=2743612 RepID=UPI001E3777CD|nr:hypothetical protein [Methylocystis silviterrae]